MKLIAAIINEEDAKTLIPKLSDNNFSVTKLESQGGFLGEQNNVLLIGTEDEKVNEVIKFIKECCRSRSENISPVPKTMEPGELIIPENAKIITSGAIIFVLDIVDSFKL